MAASCRRAATGSRLQTLPGLMLWTAHLRCGCRGATTLSLCTTATQMALPSCQQVPLTPFSLHAIEFRNLLNSDCYSAVLFCTPYCNAYSQLGCDESASECSVSGL